MPVYEYVCESCGTPQEVYAQMGASPPQCCDTIMRRVYSGSNFRDFSSHPFIGRKGKELWNNRMDEIHKRQADRGERLRMVHPKEIL